MNRISWRFAFPALLGAAGLALLPIASRAQASPSSQASVAQAAREARAARQQTGPAAKPARVITEDDLKHSNATPEQPNPSGAAPQPGSETPSAATTAEQAGSGSAKAAAATSKSAKPASEDDIKRAKDELAQAETALDFSKGAVALQQDTYYLNPEYAHDTAGKARLDALQQQAKDAQDKVDQLRARLADLQKSAPASASGTPRQ